MNANRSLNGPRNQHSSPSRIAGALLAVWAAHCNIGIGQTSAPPPLEAPVRSPVADIVAVDSTASEPATKAGTKLPNAGSTVEELESFVLQLAKLIVPDEYENTKHWGKKKTIKTGIRLTRENGRLRTRSSRKDLNHGSWYFYRVTINDPQQVQLRLDDVQQKNESTFTFTIVAEAPLTIFARHALWQLGVQLWSVHADINARVRFKADCTVEIKVNPTRIPPDVELAPKVHAVDIELLSFKITRFSQLGRDITEPFSKTVRELIENELEDRRQELPAKLNRQIDKNRKKLRLSVHDILKSKWKAWMSSDADKAADAP